MNVNRFSIYRGERNPWRKHLAITIIITYIILQTSLLYTARVSWVPVLFAGIPYQDIYCIIQWSSYIELARFNSLLPLPLCVVYTVLALRIVQVSGSYFVNCDYKWSNMYIAQTTHFSNLITLCVVWNVLFML